MSLITNDAIMQHFGYPGAVNDKVRAFFNAMYAGAGSPEGVTTAAIGAFYLDTTNGALYAKQSGSGNTGWIAGIAPGSGSGPYVRVGGLPPSAPFVALPQELVVTQVEPGHTFTAVNASASNLADTGDHVTGTQSIQATTNGNGTDTALQVTGLTAVDATDRYFKVRFKAGSLNNYQNVRFRAGNSAMTAYYEWKIAERGLTSTVDVNSWQADTLNFQTPTITGSPNRAALTDFSLVFADRNNGSTVTMHLDEISLVDDGAETWPIPPISFTFDDAYNGVSTYARPALDTYGFRATIFPIWDLIDTTGRLTTLQLQQLRDVSGWGIGTHAANSALHDATGGWTVLSAAELDAEFMSAKQSGYLMGLRSVDFAAYPQGLWNDTVLGEVRKFFTAARSTVNINYETLPPASPMLLRCWSVHNTDTVASVKAVIDAAIKYRTWLILAFHQINTSPASSTEYLNTDFAAIVDYVAAKGMPVRTIGEVLATPVRQGGMHAGSSPLGVFGDGSDGVLNFDGTTTPVAGATLSGSTYTMARDIFGTQITVASGVTIDTARFRIFARDSLINGGTIAGDGNAAAAAVVGAAKTSRSAGGGLGGGTAALSSAGGAGGGISVGGIGGAAGAGGASSGGGTGGGAAAGTFTNGTANSVPRTLANALTMAPQGSATLWQGGAGGGGGNAATNSTGGAGGGGATVVPIYARQLVNNGTITAIGGNGGAAALGSGTGAGGGGGGGGGAIILVYNTLAGTGTTDVSGGNGGALAGAGAAGAAGSTGVVYKIRA